MDWARILAYVTGAVDQELLVRNEYLATEKPCSRTPSEPRSARLVIAWVARFSPRSQPSPGLTRSARYRKLVARKFSGSQARQGPGRPRLKREVEQLGRLDVVSSRQRRRHRPSPTSE
jgi:putative transposase